MDIDPNKEYDVWVFGQHMYPIGTGERINILVRSCWPGFEITEKLVDKVSIYCYNMAIHMIEISFCPYNRNTGHQILYENYTNKLSNPKGR
jgi:hypothetical protein